MQEFLLQKENQYYGFSQRRDSHFGMNMKITLEDIAKKAGVSTATVSKCLNNRPRISKKTKQKVLSIAKELGYGIPEEALVPGLKTAFIIHKKNIAVNSDPFYSLVMSAMQESLEAQKGQLVLLTISPKEETTLYLQTRLEQLAIEAVALCGQDFSPGFIIELANSIQQPIILVDNYLPQINCYSVVNDNFQGAYMMTEYLLELNHQHIGFISGPLRNISFLERLQGFHSALISAGIKPESDLEMIFNSDNWLNPKDPWGYEATLSLISSNNPPTAIFAANDLLAAESIQALTSKNLKVPQDISVVGFDDISIASFTAPPLTTIKVGKRTLGKLAAGLLLCSNLPQGNYKVVVPPKLIIRQSTAINPGTKSP